MSIIDWIIASIIVFLGAFIQGVSGVGGGFIMVPLLAFIDLRFLPGALIFSSLSISLIMAWLGRKEIKYRETNVVLISIIPGAAVGAWLLSIIQNEKLGLFFGVMILLGVLISSLGVRLKPNFFNSVISGSIAGAMGASSGIGAPIIALLFQNYSGPELRATLAYLYTIAGSLILVVLSGFNQFGIFQMQLGVFLVPGMLIGLFVSRRLTSAIDRGKTRILVLIFAAIPAISLIITSIN
ncbi:MAG: sulfite exporter TauE/SafE family protein [Pseudomonadota bacterium]|nr:sulfite exporter TauE/SafE family protein [Pseudomonadota bacterium]